MWEGGRDLLLCTHPIWVGASLAGQHSGLLPQATPIAPPPPPWHRLFGNFKQTEPPLAAESPFFGQFTMA